MLPIIISAIENPDDRDLMTNFYLEYKSLLYREARKHLDIPEDIEDTVYEAFARIIDKMAIFRDLKHWQKVQYALTTVKNLSYILLKKNNHFTIVSFDDLECDIPADNGNSTEKSIEEKMFRTYIRQVWNEIDLDERMLLEQKYILHWKDEEIAVPLGIQPQSVRMRLTRTKRNILKALQNKGVVFSSWF